jgi:hypothetical protein
VKNLGQVVIILVIKNQYFKLSKILHIYDGGRRACRILHCPADRVCRGRKIGGEINPEDTTKSSCRLRHASVGSLARTPPLRTRSADRASVVARQNDVSRPRSARDTTPPLAVEDGSPSFVMSPAACEGYSSTSGFSISSMCSTGTSTALPCTTPPRQHRPAHPQPAPSASHSDADALQ